MNLTGSCIIEQSITGLGSEAIPACNAVKILPIKCNNVLLLFLVDPGLGMIQL